MPKKRLPTSLALGKYDSRILGVRLPVDREKLNHGHIRVLKPGTARRMLGYVLEAQQKLEVLPRVPLHVDEVSVLRALLLMAENDLRGRLKV